MPDVQIYKVGPKTKGEEGLYVPDTGSNREGPQAKEPSKCLKQGELWRKTGERGILITSYKRLKKRL